MLANLLYSSCLLATVGALPALAPVGSNGVPKDLPQAQADLYPPFTYKPQAHADYTPGSTGYPIKSVNESAKAWKHQSSSKPIQQTHVAAASCDSPTPSNPDAANYWYELIEHNGESPFINNGDTWQVFRNVVSDPYNADSTGTSDASAAIQSAINDGSSSGQSRDSGNLGTTGQPAVVYLPAGTYLINSPLQLYLGTVLAGNPLSPPTIKIGAGYSADTAIYGKDPGKVATDNFFLAIKDIIIDSTAVDKDQTLLLLDWSVSQATQLKNIVFNMPDNSGGHTGIAMPDGGGSGTMMGDLTFNGGAVGLHMDNQQYEAKTLTFNGCTTGILVTGCFDCVFVGCTFTNVGTGLDMTAGGNIGSVALIDSSASSVYHAVSTNAETDGSHTLIVGNFDMGDDVTAVVSAGGDTVLNTGVTGTWVYGNAYTAGGPGTGSHQIGTTYDTTVPAALLGSDGKYVAIPPPTYAEYGVSQVQNVKSVDGYPVAGDGVTDDTASLNAIIAQYAGCKVLFFPSGTYIVTDTLSFPPGSRVIGEAWSTISAIGSNFYNPDSPTVMVQVGNAGDVGVAQFTDMLFSVADVLQGCTLLEVNMKGNSPGDVGFWNTHFRVGGAQGSKVNENCFGSPDSCKAAFMLAHLTASSSAYIENMWGWTADHGLDGGGPETISTGRGMLVEATAATWLHGTAMEHNTLYQYNLHSAANVFIGMQQSETPYWQGPGQSQAAPSPWTPVSAIGDPDYSYCGDDAQCTMALFMQIAGSSDLFIYGSGFWTFFNNGGDCPAGGVCQTFATDVSGTTGLNWFGITTHENLNLVRDGGQATATQNNNPGGWGGVVGAYLVDL